MNRRRCRVPSGNKTEHAAYMRAWYQKNREFVLARLTARRKGLPMPAKRPTALPRLTAAEVARRNHEKAKRRLEWRIRVESRKAVNKLRRKAKEREWNKKRLLRDVPIEILPMRIALYDFRSITSGRGRLTCGDAAAIRGSMESGRKLAKKYGVSHSLISQIRRGAAKKYNASSKVDTSR